MFSELREQNSWLADNTGSYDVIGVIEMLPVWLSPISLMVWV